MRNEKKGRDGEELNGGDLSVREWENNRKRWEGHRMEVGQPLAHTT